MPARNHTLSRTRGVVAVELGIMLTFVLVPLTFGITELGRAAYQYNTLTKGVRDAARYLTTVTPGTRESATKCLAITGSDAVAGSSCGGALLLPGLVKDMVTVCDRVSCPGTHNLVPVMVEGTRRGTVHLATVTIRNYQFKSLVSFIVPSFTFGPVSATFSVKA